MEQSNSVGGLRRNAGRKTEMDTPTDRVQVSLDSTTVRLLKVLGDGNVSRGVREAARVAYAKYQRS